MGLDTSVKPWTPTPSSLLPTSPTAQPAHLHSSSSSPQTPAITSSSTSYTFPINLHHLHHKYLNLNILNINLNRTWALSPVLRQSADILIIEAVCLIDPQCTIALKKCTYNSLQREGGWALALIRANEGPRKDVPQFVSLWNRHYNNSPWYQ